MKNSRLARYASIRSPQGFFGGLIQRFKWWRREAEIIHNCGCITYCPKCHDMLNDQAYWLDSSGEGRGTYKCKACGNVSEWDFGIAPVAVMIYSAHLRSELNSPCQP